MLGLHFNAAMHTVVIIHVHTSALQLLCFVLKARSVLKGLLCHGTCIRMQRLHAWFGLCSYASTEGGVPIFV